MHEPAAPPEPIPSDPSTESAKPAPRDEGVSPLAEPAAVVEAAPVDAASAEAAPAPAKPPIEIVPQLTATLVGAMSPFALPPPVAVPPALLAAAAASNAAAAPAPMPVSPMPPMPVSPMPPMPVSPVAPHAEPAPFVPASTAFLVIVTTISLAADLVTKGWAKATLAGFDTKLHGQKRLEVWKPHFGFIFAQNPGGAWSFLRSLPDTLRRPFFLVVSAAAIVFIISIYQRVHREQTAMKWGLPIALGGAMGNLVDRMRYGWVIDFIDFSMKWGGREHHWPTFNVADIAIVVGVVLMGLDMGRSRRLPIGEGSHEGPLGSASAPPLA